MGLMIDRLFDFSEDVPDDFEGNQGRFAFRKAEVTGLRQLFYTSLFTNLGSTATDCDRITVRPNWDVVAVYACDADEERCLTAALISYHFKR